MSHPPTERPTRRSGTTPLGGVSRRPGLLLLLVVTAGVGLNHAVVHPLRNYLLDFRAYYAAGTALRMGVNPYVLEDVRAAVELPGTQSIVRFVYPPPALALCYVAALGRYPAAQVGWCLLQFVLLITAVGLVLRALRCPLGSPTSVLIGVVFLTSTAVSQLFRWGQFDGVLAALLAATLLALVRRRPAWAGLWVGLAAVSKVTPLLYVVVFLWRREGRALLASVVTIALLMGGSYVVLGNDVVRQWITGIVVYGTAPGTLVSSQNMSLLAFFSRALTEAPGGAGVSQPWIDLGPGAARWITLSVLAVVYVITAWWMTRYRRELSTAECLAVAIPLALLTSPVTWTHHGVQLLIPLAVMTTAAMRARRVGVPDMIWVGLVLVLYSNWPVEYFNLQLPSRVAHLVGPTAFYATALTWLFMIVRYVPLRRAATAVDPRCNAAALAAENATAEPAPLPV